MKLNSRRCNNCDFKELCQRIARLAEPNTCGVNDTRAQISGTQHLFVPKVAKTFHQSCEVY